MSLDPKPPQAKPSVACFIYDFENGGTVVQTVRVAAGLKARGFDVSIVAVGGNGPHRAELEAEHPVTVLGSPLLGPRVPKFIRQLRGLHLAIATLRLRKFLMGKTPDILLSCANRVNLPAAIAAKSIGRGRGIASRLVLTITNDFYHRTPKDPEGRYLAPRLARVFYARADRVFAVSEGLAEDVASLSPALKERARVIYPPLDLDAIRARRDEPVDHPWLVDKTHPVILGVGRLVQQKGFEDLVRATAVLNKGRPEIEKVRLIILGPGKEAAVQALEELAASLEISAHVDIAGYEANPFRYMNNVDCFVLSSLWEGFGIVLAEALACGCPIVSTDCRHGPEEILAGGAFGRIVPVGAPEALAAAVLEELAAPSQAEDLMQRAEVFGMDTVIGLYASELVAVAAD